MGRGETGRESVRSADTDSDVNVVVLVGTCSRAAIPRRLPSGDEVAELQITTRTGGVARSVPVSVTGPGPGVRDLGPGDEVLVVGVIRRRFFRAAGVTASRVEVEAQFVGPRGDRRRGSAHIRRAAAVLDAALAAPKPDSGGTRRYSDRAPVRRRTGTRDEKAGGQR